MSHVFGYMVATGGTSSPALNVWMDLLPPPTAVVVVVVVVVVAPLLLLLLLLFMPLLLHLRCCCCCRYRVSQARDNTALPPSTHRGVTPPDAVGGGDCSEATDCESAIVKADRTALEHTRMPSETEGRTGLVVNKDEPRTASTKCRPQKGATTWAWLQATWVIDTDADRGRPLPADKQT